MSFKEGKELPPDAKKILSFSECFPELWKELNEVRFQISTENGLPLPFSVHPEEVALRIKLFREMCGFIVKHCVSKKKILTTLNYPRNIPLISMRRLEDHDAFFLRFQRAVLDIAKDELGLRK